MSEFKIETLPGGMRKVSAGTVSSDELDAAVARANGDQHRVNADERARLTEEGDHDAAALVDESPKQRMEREHSEEKTNSTFVQDGGRVQRDNKKGIRSDPRSASIHEAPQADNPDAPADQQTVGGKPVMAGSKKG